MTNELSDLKHSYKSIESMIKQRDNEINTVVNAMKDRDIELRQLNSNNSDLKRKLDAVSSALCNKEHELERSDAKNNLLRVENDNLKEAKMRLENDNHTNKEAIKQKDLDLERLSCQLGELNKELTM